MLYEKDFEGLMVTLASEEDIKNWSKGKVENSDTVNYRTGKAKKGGLFCESIFGPAKNYECNCGKYKGVRYKGIVCETCGVEITSSRVRRTRMGHVELASPVIHAWYKNSSNGGIHNLLGLSANEIDKISSFVKYIVINPVDNVLKDAIKKDLLDMFAEKIKELDELYKAEKDAETDPKKKKEMESLYEENRNSLETEKTRLLGVISGLEKGKTVEEFDFRNFFYQYSGRSFGAIKKFYRDQDGTSANSENAGDEKKKKGKKSDASMEEGELPDNTTFQLLSGPEGIYEALKSINVESEIKKRVQAFPMIKSEDQREKAMKLIKLLINLYVSWVKPENMVLRKLPVIPPDIRPVVQLDGWRFASSDVNLFYRRVLMRNNRLNKMIQVGMPEVLRKNEIRLLQESVNNLLVGEKWGAGRGGAWVKVFKSLSDMLSGKEGIFRKNLLGKRVDYSGRSVITVGPSLKLDECGLPIDIAVSMFTPFIVGKLMESKNAYTPKQAEKLIKDEDPLALKFLEEVIKDKYILLNRAPTLHRLGIEAFKIKLYTWKTIRLHPLVCGSFNADFDGDQMAVHLPVSKEAQKEARELICSSKNILKPADGMPTISLSQDMVLGIYYLTDFYNPKYPLINTESEWQDENNVPTVARFSSKEDAYKAFENNEVEIKDKIMILAKGEPVITTVGRVIFNMVIPEWIDFINELYKKKHLKKLISKVFDEYDIDTTVKLADDLKDLWFKYSTVSAVSVNIMDMIIPKEKEDMLKRGDQKVDQILSLFYKGYFSEKEKHTLVVNVWMQIKKDLEAKLKSIFTPGNDLYTMVDSGARGSQTHLTQICGMKGLVVNPKGEIIELPVKASFAEGLKPIEYFIAAHSGRKGKADTALRTAESGYLTRKLVDSSQEVIVRTDECGSDEFIICSKAEAALRNEDFASLIYGRVVADDVIDETGTVLLRKNEMIDKSRSLLIASSSVSMLKVRSPLTCHCPSGVCQKCYGMDLASRKLVEVWTPVGVIAAQSIGEPSTQLTLDTFHDGGVVGGQDMATGIDRIKQLFEVRAPKFPAVIAPFDGTLFIEETPEGGKLGKIRIESEVQKKVYAIEKGSRPTVKVGEVLAKGGVFAISEKNKNSKQKVMEDGEVLEINADSIIFGYTVSFERKLYGAILKNNHVSGDKVFKGEVLTSGALDVVEYKDIVGDLAAQQYIINEAKKAYSDQGQDLNNKHIEIIVKQLFSKVFIENPGDSSFIPGTYVKYEDFIAKNAELLKEKKQVAKG